MAQRTDDSTITSLRELMQLEQRRTEVERLATVHTETVRRRRAIEENARAEAESVRRTLEVESAARESASHARDAQERSEAERADRELRVRLEVEHARRDAEQAVRLEHARRMAELELGARRRGVSPVAAVGLIAMTLAGVGGLGVWMRAQLHTAPFVMAPRPASTASAPDAQTAALREQIRLNHIREQQLLSALPTARAPVRPVHPACCARRPHRRADPDGDPMTGLDGPDPVAAGGN